MSATTITRTPCLTSDDARDMLRLSNALHGSPAEPAARKQLLLEGVCRLVQADGGLCAVTTCDRVTARQTVVSVIRTGPLDSATPGSPPARGSDRLSRILALADLTSRLPENCHCHDSYVDLLGMQAVATLTVYRQRGDSRPFSQRQREIVDAMHTEMAWVYRPDLLMTSPEALALPPERRATLQYLLAGHAEAQIAARVEVSRATVHNHVKALYRHFNVASRRELLDTWGKRLSDDYRPFSKKL